MTVSKISICLFFLSYLSLSLQAQNNCDESFYVVQQQQPEALLPFSTANGPGSFKRKVESSSLWQGLQGCDSTIQKIAWENILVGSYPASTGNGNSGQVGEQESALSKFFSFFRNLFKSKSKPKVSYSTEMKTAFLIVTYGYQSPVDIQKVKEFVRSEPWERGLNFSSHLAVDILFEFYNDANRDKDYHTYTRSEMKRAKDQYAAQ